MFYRQVPDYPGEQMILVTKWFGTFLCDGRKVIEKRLFPKDVDSIADRMKRTRNREILAEELELGKKADAVAERRLGSIAKVIAFDSGFIRAEDYGFDIELLRQATMKLARESLSEEDPGAFISEQIRAYDDLIATCNLMSERLREWYGLYFPGLERYVDDKKYAELISKNPRKSEIIAALGKEIDSGIGAPFSDEDLESVRGFAAVAYEAYRAKDEMERFIQGKMKEEAPNLSAVAGPIIGARLISLAGGLERLAGMPTSTIQLLGAEKAMFRHLKDKSRPPKHGVIFQHPLVHKSPYWQRGKIARALAGKISLAARTDYYSGRDISEQLVESLEKRVEEIRKRVQNPPKKPERRKKGKNPRGQGER